MIHNGKNCIISIVRFPSVLGLEQPSMGTRCPMQSKALSHISHTGPTLLPPLPFTSASVMCHSSPPCPLSKPKLPLPQPRPFLSALFHTHQHPQHLVQRRSTLLSVRCLKIPLPAFAPIVPDTSYTKESIWTRLDSCHIWSMPSLS